MVNFKSSLEICSPLDGKLAGSAPVLSKEDIYAKIDAAEVARKAWAARTAFEKANILDAAASLIMSEQEELAQLLALESGKVIAQSRMEIMFAAGLMRSNAATLRLMKGELLPTDSIPNNARDIAWVTRVPLGTIAAILPFNFPIELLIEKSAAALAIGNAVIVKTPDQTPLCVCRCIELMHKAGVPEEVLVAVNGGREEGAAVASHPAIRAISLTGSTRAGQAVAAANVERLPTLHLELGGNDAAVLLENADLELAVPQLIFGRTLMNGQSCASNKRIIVHRSLHDALLEKLKAGLESYVAGDALCDSSKIGPLISEVAAKRVEGQVAHAVEQGAKLAYRSGKAKGTLFDPCILANVPASADVAKDDEIFGPVLTLIPFDTDEEALKIANQSSYGLSGCVFSSDVGRALGFAEKMECGGVVINGTGNYRPPFVPFGGAKMSGLGREGTGYAMECLSQLKYTVLRNILPE